MKKIIIPLLVALLLCSGLYARDKKSKVMKGPMMEEGPMMPEGPMQEKDMESHGWWRFRHIVDRLELTDEQVEKLHKIKTETRKMLVDLGAELKKKQIDLQELTFADKVDKGKVKSIVKKINEIKSDIFEKLVDTKIRIWEILTPEQKKDVKKSLMRGPHRFKKRE
ncbi:MAG: Spy/CpxP family protein refolding chaperone [Spirochaetes bacterium]|nr:Spy/CpxP family protein refolding chaperone [Spirochaetota bacterium]